MGMPPRQSQCVHQPVERPCRSEHKPGSHAGIGRIAEETHLVDEHGPCHHTHYMQPEQIQ